MTLTPDEITPITCENGHTVMVADVEFNWTKKDMSDFTGKCPVCKAVYWQKKPITPAGERALAKLEEK